MLTPAKRLKNQLAANETVVGLMATDHAWPHLVEIAQQGGLDYLIIDREHGSFSDELVAHICQVARLANFPVLVRAISSEVDVLRRLIDLGPCGILLPCVESTDQLDQAAQAILMPPRGRRRPGGAGNAWVSNYNYETWKAELEDHFIVIPQIESQLGVDRAKEIAAHDIVTAMGLGPYDLSADMGCCWEPENEKYQEAIAQVKAAADAVDKKVWAGTDAPALRAKGYTFLWIGTVTTMLNKAFSDTLQSIKQGTPSKDNSPPPA
jgi:4-hydroxy-2-oxoheptanedioate aldolase